MAWRSPTSSSLNRGFIPAPRQGLCAPESTDSTLGRPVTEVPEVGALQPELVLKCGEEHVDDASARGRYLSDPRRIHQTHRK